MTIKLYTFRFSPPARLAHLVAKMIEVDHHQVEVDLSKVMMMIIVSVNRHLGSNFDIAQPR